MEICREIKLLRKSGMNFKQVMQAAQHLKKVNQDAIEKRKQQESNKQ